MWLSVPDLIRRAASRRARAAGRTAVLRDQAARRTAILRAQAAGGTGAARRAEPLLLRRISPPVAVATVLVAAASGAALLVTASLASPSPPPSPQWVTSTTPDPVPTPEPPAHQVLRSLAVAPQTSPARPPPSAFTAWAIMDLRSGAITGSPNLGQTSTTASMIKAWLVADYLRQTSDPPPRRLEDLSVIIRDSRNALAQELFEELGEEESIHRLIDICQLTDSSAVPGYWSNTRLSPRDTVRMGACLADGRAAGPQWTSWLLDEMRQVRGLGDFGIRHAFPEELRVGIAIKNGWVVRDESGEYHVNCLAVGDTWSMGVMTRYPAQLGYQHGAEICRSLAAEHLVPRVL